MVNVRYTFVNASAPFVPPARAWCCGVVEGEFCAETCPRVAVYDTIERAAVEAVVLRTGKDPEFVRAVSSLWSALNTRESRETFDEVRAEADHIRNERGVCEHYAPDRRSCPDCLGPAGRERMRAEELRKENRRFGEEIARNPPGWAYPLAWRLAVMTEVKRSNNRPEPETRTRAMRLLLESCLKPYHALRLGGLTANDARTQVLAEETYKPAYEWIPNVCAAYERGRPGGVNVGRPA